MELFTGGKPFIELTRDELLKIKNQEAFIPIIYSEIVVLLKNKYGNDYTLQRLRKMGHMLADGILKHWTPHKIRSVQDIIEETYQVFLYRGLKTKKVLDKIYVRDENCPVCYFNVSDSDIPFCIVISGLIERIINNLRKYNPKLPEISVDNISSRSMGKDLCIHAISFK